VKYVVLASNDFAVIASIIFPAYNLDNDKMPSAELDDGALAELL
jgi:hypothetical protein